MSRIIRATHDELTKSVRVRAKDLEEAIYHPLDKQPDQQEQSDERQILAFCFSGNEDDKVKVFGEDSDLFPILFDEEEGEEIISAQHRKNSCAYCSLTNERKRYFIKSNSRGNFLNPIGLYDENRQNKHVKHLGRPEWLYKEVSYKVFVRYINFLRSKNQAHLKNAEREAI